MAIVIPFGDAQAHGSLADSICFRRHKGRVVLQKKPHARQPGTPGQLAQRQKFKDGWTAFHGLNLWELQYVQTKATQAQTSPSAWYLSQFLTDEIPSQVVQKGIKQITDLDLPEVVGGDPQEIQFTFFARTDPSGDVELAHIWDNQNTPVIGAVASPYDRAFIKIFYGGIPQIVIPFDYPVLIDWNNFSDEPKNNLIRLPEIHLAPAPSTQPFGDMRGLSAIDNLETSAPGANQVFQTYWAEWGPGPSEIKYNDDPLPCTQGGQAVQFPNFPAEHTAMRIEFSSSFAGTWSVPDNWTVKVFYIDDALVQQIIFIAFPAFALTNGQTREFWMSDDTSLWNDRAMTSLAKNNGPQEIDLYLANDFSVYYNEGLTQLANSPYF